MPFRPFNNELGERIYNEISLQAWQMWLQESPRYINTYRLDLQSEQGRGFMEQQMKLFFKFEEGEMAETAWVPTTPGEERPADAATESSGSDEPPQS